MTPCSKIGRSQHLALWPIAAQIAVKLAMSVGGVGGVAQSKSTRPRTSVAQHSAEPVPHWKSWRFWKLVGVPKATAAKTAARANEVLIFAVGVVCFKRCL